MQFWIFFGIGGWDSGVKSVFILTMVSGIWDQRMLFIWTVYSVHFCFMMRRFIYDGVIISRLSLSYESLKQLTKIQLFRDANLFIYNYISQ